MKRQNEPKKNPKNKKQNKTKPQFNMGKGSEQMFLQRDTRMIKEHMERYLPSLAPRKMQIKTKMIPHFTHMRLRGIKRRDSKEVLARMWRKQDPQYPNWWAGKTVQLLW